MGKNGPTLHEVAKAAGVSIATVSRVARGLDDVTPATRDRVLRTIQEMDYRASHFGRALVRRSHDTLGIVFPGLRGPYYSEVIHGFEVEAVHARKSVLILGTELIGHANDQVRGMTDRADGLVIMGGSSIDDGTIQRLVARGVPIVLLARSPLAGIPAVRVDNLGATFELTRHLLEDHGYRRLVFVGNIEGAPDASERWEGYLEAHRRFGVEPPERPVPVGFDEYAGAAAARMIFAEHPYPDAIVCANDEIAFGIASVATARNIDIPGEVALTGWDDIPLAAIITPPLTTIRQPTRDLGSMTARLLLEMIDGRTPAPLDTILETRLIRRASCGCGRRDDLLANPAIYRDATAPIVAPSQPVPEEV